MEKYYKNADIKSLFLSQLHKNQQLTGKNYLNYAAKKKFFSLARGILNQDGNPKLVFN